MKGALFFKLPEDRSDFETAQRAIDYKIALEDFANYLRSQLKYNDKLTEVETKLLEEVREKFYEILDGLEIH